MGLTGNKSTVHIAHFTFIISQIALTDFGVAKHMPNTESTITAGIGTINWMAPEVMREPDLPRRRYGHQADVYGFGMIALFICCRYENWVHPPSPLISKFVNYC